MKTNGNPTAALDKCLFNSPENINMPRNADIEILSEFVESTKSVLEELEGVILAFESKQIPREDFVSTARRILHNIKGESGIMDLAEISNVCHQAETLLYHDTEKTHVESLFSVKDWLSRAMEYIKSTEY